MLVCTDAIGPFSTEKMFWDAGLTLLLLLPLPRFSHLLIVLAKWHTDWTTRSRIYRAIQSANCRSIPIQAVSRDNNESVSAKRYAVGAVFGRSIKWNGGRRGPSSCSRTVTVFAQWCSWRLRQGKQMLSEERGSAPLGERRSHSKRKLPEYSNTIWRFLFSPKIPVPSTEYVR